LIAARLRLISFAQILSSRRKQSHAITCGRSIFLIGLKSRACAQVILGHFFKDSQLRFDALKEKHAQPTTAVQNVAILSSVEIAHLALVLYTAFLERTTVLILFRPNGRAN
jgi:hypothetical protein